MQLNAPTPNQATIQPTGGEPLAPDVRSNLERSFGVELGSVRVHTDERAQNTARSMDARAFTLGTNIFLGPGERPNDLRLLAHEVAHVMQQRSVPAVQRWSFSGGDRYEREAHQAAAAVTQHQAFTVREQTTPQPQRWGISDALDFFANAANNIPGFTMLTFVLGFNPINLRSVERNAVNLFRAIIGFLPGGNLIFQALQTHGIIDQVGGWVQQQLGSLGYAASSLRQALDRFLDSLSWTDIFDLDGVWDRAKRIFTEPIDRIISFLVDLVSDILRFIRDAILRPVARLAEGTRGYDLMRLILGQDPITGDPYPRTPENMIGGFMRLIGQEEKWQYLQQSNAIPRAWAWFQQQVGTLLGFVQQIPHLFVQLWESLQISDLLDIGGAFNKVRNIFGGFVESFISWAGEAALQIIMFIFEVLAPGAMPVLRRAAAVFRIIVSDPIRFVGNLVRAGIQGFRQFAANIRTHLINGLVGWLTGALGGAGIQLPTRWDLRGILSLVLQILGLTWQNIRQKLVRVMGETAVTVLETTFDIVVTLVREGPAAAWQKILENLQNLQEMVFGQIREWVTQTIVVQAVTRIASMLNPAGAVIQAIIAIYNTIMFVRERLQQIIQVAEAFLNSIAEIAAGNIGAAANFVERTMARLVPVVISFLARLIGLGGISDTIRNIIARIRAPIDRALDRVVDWIRNAARNIASRALGGNPNAPASERVANALQEAVPIVNRYAGRPVGAAILRPLLLPLKLRHRLTSIDVVARGDIWLVDAAASPGTTAVTAAKVDASNPDEWPTGTRDDPIPMRWYKPSSIYPTLNGQTPTQGVTLPATARRVSRRLQISSSNFLDVGQVLSRRDEERADDKKDEIKRHLDDVVASGQVTSSQANYAIDHVRDLAWYGRDVYTNLWPLDRGTNNAVNASHYQYVRAKVRDRVETHGVRYWSTKYFWIAEVVNPPSSAGGHGTDERRPMNGGMPGVPKKKP